MTSSDYMSLSKINDVEYIIPAVSAACPRCSLRRQPPACLHRSASGGSVRPSTSLCGAGPTAAYG